MRYTNLLMQIDNSRIKNILCVRNDRFGEFLLCIPALRALKESFPGSKLTLVADSYIEGLARQIEAVDNVLTWENKKHKFGEVLKFSRELKAGKFDLCVIFNPSKESNLISFLAGIAIRVGYDRKWGILLTHRMQDKKCLGEKHEIEYNLDLVGLIGAKTQNKVLSLKIDEGLFDIEGRGSLIAIHPWTSDPVKQWPVDNFVSLSKKLADELNNKVLIIGGSEEADKGRRYFENLSSNIINLTGKTSLTQLGALLKKCRVLVSGDSGPVHLASCAGIPSVVVFRNDLAGKTARRWGPMSFGSAVIEKPNLADIKVEEVFEKVKGALNR